jgi:glycosyltransferase involved in cell wall biosynthesis
MMSQPDSDNLPDIRTVVIGPSPRFLSGISYYTLRLCNALVCRTTVSAVLFRYMLPVRLFPGWKRVGTDLSQLRYSDRIMVQEILDWFNPVTWLKASRMIRENDVVILQWWTSSVAHMYLAIQLLNLHHKPVLIEFHEVVDPFEHSVMPIRIYSRLMGRLIRRFAHRYTVHSEHDRRLISGQYHIPEEKIAVIPHGLYDHYPVLDREFARRTADTGDGFIFLFFGLLRPYKGVIHLIHAFEQLSKEIIGNSRLLIVGEAWEDTKSAHAAGDSPVHDRIRLVDRYVSDEEVPAFFSAADVLVLPYTRASQSGVAHIGISYGLPIIASQVGGLAESLDEYEGTIFVTPEDEPSLIRAMEQAYHAEVVKYPVPDHLRWDSVADRYIHVLQEMTRGSP